MDYNCSACKYFLRYFNLKMAFRPNYLAEVRKPTRWTAIALLLLAAAASSACFLLSVGVAIVGPDNLPIGPLCGCLAVFGLLSITSGWILIRLLRRQRANNGKTVMPEWFIQFFGGVFLLAICITAVANNEPWLFGEAIGVAVAMIGIRVMLRREESASNES